MKKISFFLLITVFAKMQITNAQSHQISIQAAGAYFFDDKGNNFKMPFQQMKLPTSLSYLNIKNKSGIQLTATMYSFGYTHVNSKFNTYDEKLIARSGFLLSADYLQQLMKKKNADAFFKFGLSSKLSSTDIRVNYLTCFYPGSNQIGGLAINLGVNANVKIWKHLYYTSNLRSVNFVLGGNNQRNSIWFENGLSYRFENTDKMKEARSKKKEKRNPKYTHSLAINTNVYNDFGRKYKQSNFYFSNRPIEKTFNYKIQKKRLALEYFQSNFYDNYYSSNEYILRTIPIGDILFEKAEQKGITIQYTVLQNRHVSFSPFIGFVQQKLVSEKLLKFYEEQNDIPFQYNEEKKLGAQIGTNLTLPIYRNFFFQNNLRYTSMPTAKFNKKNLQFDIGVGYRWGNFLKKKNKN